MNDFASKITLDKTIPIPLYYQLKQQMLNMIENGTLSEDDMLPPENELCILLEVSRPTIRQAFNELVSEGHLERFRGRGTFVSKPKIEAHFFSKLESFNDEIRAKNMTPHTKVLALEKLTGHHDVENRLKLEPGSPLILLSRLRLADDVPLVYVDTYLPYDEYSGLLDVDFNEKSLYSTLEEIYKVRVKHVSRRIEAVNARRREASLLNISVNKAISLVKTIGSDENKKAIEYSVARYRGDMNVFDVELYR